jgi:hypothetical protein
MRPQFSPWARWKERHALDRLQFPGVYALAISDEEIAGAAFSWRDVIVYVGMSNARSGLRSRLAQFDNTIRGKEGHGGRRRVRFKHRDYSALNTRLFVSVWPFECNPESADPSDLRVKGEVAKSEWECLASFTEKFGRLPEFNDKKRSPKL